MRKIRPKIEQINSVKRDVLLKNRSKELDNTLVLTYRPALNKVYKIFQ